MWCVVGRVVRRSAAGKATVSALVKSSLAKLKELVDKVPAIPDVNEKIKTVVAPVMARFSDLAAG
jgi:hypothetical protein